MYIYVSPLTSPVIVHVDWHESSKRACGFHSYTCSSPIPYLVIGHAGLKLMIIMDNASSSLSMVYLVNGK